MMRAPCFPPNYDQMIGLLGWTFCVHATPTGNTAPSVTRAAVVITIVVAQAAPSDADSNSEDRNGR